MAELARARPSAASVKEGIDAVIVDNVLAIRKGLTEAQGKPVVGGANGTPHVTHVPETTVNGDVTGS